MKVTATYSMRNIKTHAVHSYYIAKRESIDNYNILPERVISRLKDFPAYISGYFELTDNLIYITNYKNKIVATVSIFPENKNQKQ